MTVENPHPGRMPPKKKTGMKQRPLQLNGASKTDVRTQFGALCWRKHKGELQVALVTSRGTKSWIIPKGWPMDEETPAQAAATEALEEAGLEGRPSDTCIGLYSYLKEISSNVSLPCVVAVFPIKVKKVHGSWPESGERKRRWMSQRKAAAAVQNPELSRIIRDFDPRNLPR